MSDRIGQCLAEVWRLDALASSDWSNEVGTPTVVVLHQCGEPTQPPHHDAYCAAAFRKLAPLLAHEVERLRKQGGGFREEGHNWRSCICGIRYRPAQGLYGTTEQRGCPACILREKVQDQDRVIWQHQETNTRLNRRCQVLEAGIAEKVSDNPPRSLGRALANAAATSSKEEAQRLALRLAGVQAREVAAERMLRKALRALRVLWRGYRDDPGEALDDDLENFPMTPKAKALAKEALDELEGESDEADPPV
jgi:hypothetical protein